MSGRESCIALWLMCLALLISGCAVGRFTQGVLVTTGNVVWIAGKATVATGKAAFGVVRFTGDAAYKTAKFIVQIPGGRRTVALGKRGNALFVNTILNRKVNAVLGVDTGCAYSQISRRVADMLGVGRGTGQPIQCGLAGGYIVTGRLVNIREIRLDSVRAFNVQAVVLDEDRDTASDGLLGMSFLNNFVFKIDSTKQTLTLERRG